MSWRRRQVTFSRLAPAAAALLLSSSPLRAGDTAGIPGATGRRPLQLWPRTLEVDKRQEIAPPIDLGAWTYHAVRSGSPRDGVPWVLTVTPSPANTDGWQKGVPPGAAASRIAVVVRRAPPKAPEEGELPVAELPDALWKNWLAADLQDVVGIHFHRLVTDDTARILFTLHKVPPDNPDGSPPPPGSYKGPAGTRIEATLLAPVVYNLDQSIVVRVDALHKELTAGRASHEKSHAELSLQVFLAALRGPQDWDAEHCTGRRSIVEFYWMRGQFGQSWQGYRDGVGKLATLRTSVALLPPTRWSMLLPIPPERVTQQHLHAMNDAIVFPEPRFAEADRVAQARFHAQHGAFERASSP